MFYPRSQHAFVVVVRRPDSDPREAIEVELAPEWDEQGLIGYHVAATGEASFTTDLPPELSCLNLGSKLSITALGKDFIFGFHSTHSKWKDARKMVAADRLRFLQPAPAGSKSSTPATRVSKDDTLATLLKNPLAVRLELLRREDVMHLALTAVPGVSALLNNGSHDHDPDDVSIISRLPVVTVDSAMVLIYQSGVTPSDVARDEALRELFEAFLPEHVALYASPGRTQRAREAREDFQFLVAKHEILRRDPDFNSTQRKDSESLDTTGPTPSTSSESSSREGTVPPVLDPSRPGNKFDHIVPPTWFYTDMPLSVRKIISAGICKSTADQYGPYVSNWLEYCAGHDIRPTDPSIRDLMTYLSLRAELISASSISINLAAIKFFLKVNLASQDLFSHPSLSTFLKGLANSPRVTNSTRKVRLTMSREALMLTGHIIQSLSAWPPIDRTMAWALTLVCFFGCSRVGDLLSNTANKVSAKTITWETISLLPDGKMLIYIPSPKTSVGNKGLPITLTKNPDTRLCPVYHMSKLRAFYNNSGPVFRYLSGKLFTPSALNKILKETSKLAGVPDDAQYSCHSLRAAVPTFIASNPSSFSYTELLAAGRWRSTAAHAYVRCDLRASDNLSRKVYNLS